MLEFVYNSCLESHGMVRRMAKLDEDAAGIEVGDLKLGLSDDYSPPLHSDRHSRRAPDCYEESLYSPG